MSANLSPTTLFVCLVATALIGALIPPAVRFGVQLAQDAKAKLKASMSAEQWDQLAFYAEMLVRAAEQSGLKNELMKDGKAKMDWVLDQLGHFADDLGLHDLPLDQLEQLAESKVYEVLNANKPKSVTLNSAWSAGEAPKELNWDTITNYAKPFRARATFVGETPFPSTLEDLGAYVDQRIHEALDKQVTAEVDANMVHGTDRLKAENDPSTLTAQL